MGLQGSLYASNLTLSVLDQTRAGYCLNCVWRSPYLQM